MQSSYVTVILRRPGEEGERGRSAGAERKEYSWDCPWFSRCLILVYPTCTLLTESVGQILHKSSYRPCVGAAMADMTRAQKKGDLPSLDCTKTVAATHKVAKGTFACALSAHPIHKSG